ncbi:MAG: hypothetical protein ISS87_00205 [Candidatus Pacebacteria bacterium]|nr:hypothetical protein [Candidatus Paceibacterota bacterium]
MNFNELLKFKKEFKQFTKKYKSLNSDLREFKNIISIMPLGNSKHFNIITQTANTKIIKARFFCRYLKGSSLRIIYSYIEEEKRIDFIEIYFKGDKENEDRERIKEYLKSLLF